MAKRYQNFHLNLEESLPTVLHKMSRTRMMKSRVNPIRGEEQDGFSTSINNIHRCCLSNFLIFLGISHPVFAGFPSIFIFPPF